ncbi:hypothetical protein Ait01nite_066500 [Actinoplanes italicus]|uniref:DNA-binding beta-propeller fold protein YncE n=1 Tax=Actinoplanes italicus TaxID=113567 RepID=A0A2T0KQL6_9ACTN|nr:hypothetical protein [Actinoplanes italicus]PRX26020.1 hypothetical protein CLV67_101748 [Actinoplanes italicus]GIE33605.1 hypothetical protein Ait01nite_066500 [Actinoplanes italicus]
MRISRVALAATVLAGASAMGFGLSVGTASADTDEKLPIKSFGDIAVDAVHKRVFVSDPAAGKIVAMNYQGHETVEVTGLTGVRGLQLSADSSTLYAAVSGARKVVALTTETLTESASYPVGENGFVSDVVGPINGKLWFSTQNSRTGTIGSVDLATSEIAVHDASADGVDLYAIPAISTGAGAPGLIVLTDTDTTSGESVVYDVSSGAADLKLETRVFGTFTSDVAISGNGGHLIQVGYNGSNRIALADGAKEEAYTNLDNFGGVEVASDGRVALAIRGTSFNGFADVQVFQPGAATPELTFKLPAVSGSYNRPEAIGRSLAWEPGGSRLFVIGDGDGDTFWLYTLNDPDAVEPDPTPSTTSPSPASPTPGNPTTTQPSEPSLLISAPATATRGKPLTLTGSLTLPPSTPVGTEVVIERSDMDARDKVVGTAKTGENGSWSFTDVPTAGGTVTYGVRYAGSVQYPALVNWTFLEVSRATPGLVIDKGNSVNAYGSTVTFTVTLGKTYKNRVVEIFADPASPWQGNSLIKKGTVNSAGKLSVSYRLTYNTKLAVVFKGDAQYAPRTVTATAYTKVNVSTRMFKHYKTKKIGSTSYYVYRTKRDPEFTHTMTHYPRRIERTVIQKYSGGKWRNYSSGYFELVNGKSELIFEGTFKAGQRFRVRSEYIPGAYGRDNFNYTTYGAWRYWTFTK